MKYFSLLFLIELVACVTILHPKEFVALEYRPERGRGPLPFKPANHSWGPHQGKRSWVHVADADYVNSTAYIGEAPKSYHRTVLNASIIARQSSSNEASSNSDEGANQTSDSNDTSTGNDTAPGNEPASNSTISGGTQNDTA